MIDNFEIVFSRHDFNTLMIDLYELEIFQEILYRSNFPNASRLSTDCKIRRREDQVSEYR